MAMTFDEMQAKVQAYLSDDGSRWSLALIGAYINDAQRDFARGSQILRLQSNPLPAGGLPPANAFYQLPTDFFELDAVYNDGRRLRRLSREDLGEDVDTITGTPYGYLFGEYSLTELRVYPTPSAVLTELKVLYVSIPADIQSLETTLIPSQYHIALVYYAVAQCYIKDNQYKDPTKGQQFMAMYERELADATSRAARAFSSDAEPIRPRYL